MKGSWIDDKWVVNPVSKTVSPKYVTIGQRELKHYDKESVRRVTFDINPTQTNVSALKTRFENWLKKIPFTKGIPEVEIKGDTLIYKYKGKPTIHYDVKKGTFKVTDKDFKKYGGSVCHNQANYLVENIKKFSNEQAELTGKESYITVKYERRKPRPDVGRP